MVHWSWELVHYALCSSSSLSLLPPALLPPRKFVKKTRLKKTNYNHTPKKNIKKKHRVRFLNIFELINASSILPKQMIHPIIIIIIIIIN